MKRRLFLESIDFDLRTNCWNWVGNPSHRYPGMTWKGTDVRLHRLVAHLFRGFDLKSKLRVLHKCDNTRCINPSHFFFGTQKDNVQDMLSKRRSAGQKQTHCDNGHEFTVENTNSDKRGWRSCRLCKRIRDREHYKKKSLA